MPSLPPNILRCLSWLDIVAENAAICARSRADHGFTSDGAEAAYQIFKEACQRPSLSLPETVDKLREMHALHPFLCFNGNTFCKLVTELVHAFADSPRWPKSKLIEVAAWHVGRVTILSKSELEEYFGS